MRRRVYKLLGVAALIWLAAFAWLGFKQYKRQAAIAGLERRGATLRFAPRKWAENAERKTGLAFTKVGAFRRVSSVFIPNFTEADLKLVRELTDVQTLVLAFSGDSVRNEWLVHLEGLNPMYLCLYGVDDVGVESLLGMSKLRWLHLRHPQLTAAGLARLKVLKYLRGLDLQQCEDDRVAEIRAGSLALQQASPKLRILLPRTAQGLPNPDAR